MKKTNITLICAIGLLSITIIFLLVWVGCTLQARARMPLCTDFADRTTINIKGMLRQTPRFVERRLSHLESMSIISAEHMEILNFRLEDGGRLKVNFRDGYAIGFTLYHNVPFHTAYRSIEVLGFNRYELRDEQIKPYSHEWTAFTSDRRELKIYALRESDFDCWTMAQAFIVSN